MNKKSNGSDSHVQNPFSEDDIICKYTSKQAVEDGILVDLSEINPKWEKGIFNYVTTNLLIKGGYLKWKKHKIANILDLLNQALHIVKTKTKNFKEMDYFFSGKIELPNGDMQEIFIQQNKTGKFSIMLPGDY
ncbi:MAG: hypothetical protein ACOCWG_04025 [bacterium]